MAVPAEENSKQELEQSAEEELDENEAQKSLDDFVRDTNELVGSTTEDNVRSPASSDDADGEFVIFCHVMCTILYVLIE